MRRFVTGLLILVSAVALVLSSTSLWTRHNVINTGVFVANVETMIDLPQVEARINDRVTTTVMTNPDVQDAVDQAAGLLPPRLQQFRPTLENGMRSLVSAGVGRLLSADPFRPLSEAALTSAHTQLVNGEPVRFTLGQAKNLVPDSARDGLAGQVLDLLPDNAGVTLLTPADAPQVYTAIDLLESAWWWLGLVALAAIAGALGLSRYRRGTLRAWAVTTTVFALLVLATLRVARGTLLPQVRPENRDAVGAIYDVLAGSLRSWTLWLLGGALLLLVLTLVWGRLGLVAGARRGVAAARMHLQTRHEAAAAAATGDLADADGAGGVQREPWFRRVAAGTRAFADGVELPERTARLGGFVRDHLRPARWTGIVVGVLVLLFWDAPTLSVLIWIGALVALWLGALEWLQSRAPEPTPAGTPEAAPPVPPAVVPDQRPANGSPSRGAMAASPALATQTVPAPAIPVQAAVPVEPAPSPLVPPALTPEAITTLTGRLDLLVRLSAARDSGVLTEEEFSREKGRLLGV